MESGAGEGTDVDPLVWTQVVEDVSLEDGWHGFDGALGIRGIVDARAGHGVSRRHDVDLALWVRVAETATREDRDQVAFVVDPLEVGHLGAEERRIRGVAHSRGTVGDGTNMNARWEVHDHHKCVKLREGSTKRMSDLRPCWSGPGNKECRKNDIQ